MGRKREIRKGKRHMGGRKYTKGGNNGEEVWERVMSSGENITYPVASSEIFFFTFYEREIPLSKKMGE